MRKLQLEELNRLSIDDYKSTSKLPLTIVLDNIRSGHNVGSIFRSADAMGIKQIILTGITPVPPHKEIQKTAIGASKSVDWVYEKDITECLTKLKEQKAIIIAAEQTDKSVLLSELSIKEGEELVLILGNEVDGVSKGALPLLDYAVEIPQFGTKHSLNVAVCAGIIMWHFRASTL